MKDWLLPATVIACPLAMMALMSILAHQAARRLARTLTLQEWNCTGDSTLDINTEPITASIRLVGAQDGKEISLRIPFNGPEFDAVMVAQRRRGQFAYSPPSSLIFFPKVEDYLQRTWTPQIATEAVATV